MSDEVDKDEGVETEAPAAKKAKKDEPVVEKKSAIHEWWDKTPIGGFLDAAGEDIKAAKDRRAAERAAKGEVDAVSGAAPSARDSGDDEDRPRGGRRGRDRDRDDDDGGSAPTKPVVAPPAAPPAPAAPQEDVYAGAKASMGADATEYLQKSQEAAKKLAEETAQTSALGAARQALSAARTSGLSAGEAALSSGAQAGETYGQTYGTAVGQGMDRYAGATAQFGALAGQRKGEELTTRGQDIQKYLGEKGVAVQEAQQKSQNTMGWLGVGAGVLGALLSDEDAKKNVTPTTDVSSVLAKLKGPAKQTTTVEQVLAKVRPVRFDYKGEADGGNRVGVIAQDLEKTPLKEVVQEGPTGLKQIDAAQLTGGNTAMILELAQMVIDMRKELQNLKGAK